MIDCKNTKSIGSGFNMSSLNLTLLECGLTENIAASITQEVSEHLKHHSPEHAWKKIVKNILCHPYPFSVHEILYKTIYPEWEQMPAPAWIPDDNFILSTHIATLMREKGFIDYSVFHAWTVTHHPEFWQNVLQKLNIIFDKPYQEIVDLSSGIETPQWFPGSKLNIMNSCFQADKNATAIIFQSELGEVKKISYSELDHLSNRIANSLNSYVKKGDKIAIIMPMTAKAVAIYLGIIKAGCVVVSIADSFSADEIAVRIRISETTLIFCQDNIIRDNKSLPFYSRIKDGNPCSIIVIPAENKIAYELRDKDIIWDQFLQTDETFVAISCLPNDPINILFSSGTTSEPKAIPWNQTTPVKCASDAYFHQNIQPGDILCWPTNLGWMMGPWLIFAAMLNQATIALYEGTPNGKEFGKFVQDNKVTLLGVVPTLVKTWRNSACMEEFDWSAIKLFSSSGERSDIIDMLYLMSLAQYRPIVEYCGGTEIGGAYITSSLLQPSAPAAFTSKALGLDFVIIDENGYPTDNGEVALIPPSIGLSTELLNKNHHEVYYENMPTIAGKHLRRHGDQVKRFANGYYRLMGRVDDTMKLGGIKISSAEIETLLNTLPYVLETAAVAITPVNGGPSQLVIYTVLNSADIQHTQLKVDMQNLIKQKLNPLFKIHEVIIIDKLPRTASNKIMRRVLRGTQY